MQVEWYRSFMETVKWKSLSKAAEKLNLTQPAISKHIRNLEAAYGVELFRRSAAGVELTEPGSFFYKKIAPVVESIAAIESEMRPFSEKPRYTLGSLPSVAAHVLPGRLRDHHAAGYPITVSVRASSQELAQGLQEGVLDAVLMDDAYADGRMWIRTLFAEGFVAVLPDGHRLGAREELTVKDLEGEPFVFPSCCDSRFRFTKAAMQTGYSPNVRMEADNSEYMLGIVAVGTCITVLPELFGEQAKRLGLHAVPMKEPGLSRTIVLAARNHVSGSNLYRLLENR